MDDAGQPLRILLVEDDADSAEELAELLESYGWSVGTAHTTREAEQLRTASEFDLAIIDLELGADSGVDLALQWGALAPALHIVLLSGRKLSQPEQARLGRKIPDVLIKPLEMGALLAALPPSTPAETASPPE